MGYFTNACIQGPVRCMPISWKIAVHRSRCERTMIGVAARVGTTKLRNPVWSLNVRGAEVPGKFIVVRGRFLRFGNVSG
jgi:hypothetical protein